MGVGCCHPFQREVKKRGWGQKGLIDQIMERMPTLETQNENELARFEMKGT